MANQPKKYKKFVITAASAALVASAVAPVASAAYTDTTSLSPADLELVTKATDLGYFQGDGSNFNPYAKITRGQVVKVLARQVAEKAGQTVEAYFADKKLEDKTIPFSDVPATHVDKELFKSSLIVKDAAVFEGNSNVLNFSDNMSRQQMASVLVRAFGLETVEDAESTVTDSDKAGSHKANIDILSQNGVTIVSEFKPLSELSRVQMARFVVRSHEVANPAEVEAPEVASVMAINANDVTQSLPATDVVANSTFEVKFSEDVDASTVTTGTIFLTQAGVKQLATVSYNSAKKIATVELSAGNTLAPGKAYVLTVDGVKADGKAIAKSVTEFSVSIKPIVAAVEYSKTNATIAGGSLASLDGAVVEEANEQIQLTFNKTMDQNTLNSSNIKLYNITKEQYEALDFTAVVTTATTVTFEADAGLTLKDDYRLEVGTGVEDLAGNKLAAVSYNFFYGLTAPQVDGATKSPAAPFTGVYNKITASGGNDAFKFRAQFDAAVDASTVNGSTVKLINKATGATVDSTVTYEAGSRFVIVTPIADLKELTDYEVVIDGVKTSKGIKVAKDVTSFSTGDFTLPTIVSSTPANAADGVAVDGTYTINFSEKMKASTLALGTDVTLYDVSGKATVASFANWTSSLSQDGKTLTIKPSAGTKLDPNKTYRLTVKDTATDSVGNALAEDYKVLFNTQVAASTKVESVQTGTAYNTANKVVESGVTSVSDAMANNLYINFDQKLSSTDLAANVKVEKKNSNGTYTVVTAYTPSLVNNAKTIEIDKITAAWDADTTYRVTVSSAAKDVNGNDIQKVNFEFTTGPSPVVNVGASSPTNFDIDVAVNEKYLAVVIDDVSDLQSSTLNADNVKVVKKSDGTAAPYSIDSVNYANKADTPALATVTGGGLAANEFTVAAGDTSKFKVGDIVTFSAGATGTAVVTTVDVTANTIGLNKDLAGLSIADTVTFHKGAVLKLNNGAKLDSNTEYDVKVKDIKDAAGNIVKAATYTFRTDTVTGDLDVTGASITNGATGIATNQVIEVNFNEAITNVTDETPIVATAAATDDTTRVSLKAKGGAVVPGEVRLTNGGKTIQIVPTEGYLDVDTVYEVKVDATVEAGASNAIGTDYDLTFRTATTSAAAITSADFYDIDGDGVANEDDIIRVTFNTTDISASLVDAVADFLVTGPGSDITGATVAQGSNYVDIKLGATDTITPALSTIKVIGADSAKFTTDAVTIVKK